MSMCTTFAAFTSGGWVPSVQSEESKSEQDKECMDLKHCMHWLHLEPTHLLHA
jgi:hypothetical protein